MGGFDSVQKKGGQQGGQKERSAGRRGNLALS